MEAGEVEAVTAAKQAAHHRDTSATNEVLSATKGTERVTAAQGDTATRQLSRSLTLASQRIAVAESAPLKRVSVQEETIISVSEKSQKVTGTSAGEAAQLKNLDTNSQGRRQQGMSAKRIATNATIRAHLTQPKTPKVAGKKTGGETEIIQPKPPTISVHTDVCLQRTGESTIPLSRTRDAARAVQKPRISLAKQAQGGTSAIRAKKETTPRIRKSATRRDKPRTRRSSCKSLETRSRLKTRKRATTKVSCRLRKRAKIDQHKVVILSPATKVSPQRWHPII